MKNKNEYFGYNQCYSQKQHYLMWQKYNKIPEQATPIPIFFNGMLVLWGRRYIDFLLRIY